MSSIRLTEGPVLSIDSTTDVCSVSLWLNNENQLSAKLKQPKGHSKKINDIIDSILNISGTKYTDLKYMVISAGPGSFTGLRLSFTIAKAISLATSVMVAAVPTLDAAAYMYGKLTRHREKYRVLSKAGSKEYFGAEFQWLNDKLICLSEIQLLSLESLLSADENVTQVFLNGYVKEAVNGISVETDSAACNLLFLDNPDKYIISDPDLLSPDYHKEFLVKRKS